MTKDAWDIALVILTGIGALFTGVAAVATAFAARGAYKAANVALEIANRQADREEHRAEGRAEVHAGFIYKQMVVVRGFIEDMQPLASGISAASKPDVLVGLASQLRGKGTQLERALDAVRPKNVAELPAVCAAATAAALSNARFASQVTQSVWEKAQTGSPEVQNQAKKIAARLETHSVEILSGLKAYFEYAVPRFGNEY